VVRQIFVSLIFALFTDIALNAQASPTATRAAFIQVGAGVSVFQPDYNPGTIKGYSIYGTYDFTSHIGLEGDIHIVNVITPGDIAENSYLLGPRFVMARGRFHPYAKALAGIGVFTFQPVYVNSSSSSSSHKMYAFGGGLDVRVKRHWNVRAIDFEYQRWPGFDANGITPLGITVGAAYFF
jgi:Outer membrane protein beta-barrel domain